MSFVDYVKEILGLSMTYNGFEVHGNEPVEEGEKCLKPLVSATSMRKLAQNKKYEEVLRHYEESEAFPDWPYDVIAYSFYQLGNFEASLKFSCIAKERNQSDFYTNFFLAKSYQKLELIEEAIECFFCCLELPDKDVDLIHSELKVLIEGIEDIDWKNDLLCRLSPNHESK